MFPEGTIYDRGSLRKIKRGVALLALRTGLPVVPLAFRGCYEAFPEGARVPRPGRLHVRFEEPMRYAKTTDDPIPEAHVVDSMEHIRCRIMQALAATPLPDRRPMTPTWLKELHIVLCALVILPLSSFLTYTANPSLDPVKNAHA
jgi:1-acyl-sn-glycerol-3-phosphate acyltransferase